MFRPILSSVVLLALAGPAAAQGRSRPVHVHVWTATADAAASDQKEREDSVADLRKALDTLDTKLLIDWPKEGSQIQVEIVRRALVPSGTMEPANRRAAQPTRDQIMAATVFATLRSGDASADLVCSGYNPAEVVHGGVGEPFGSSWRAAAAKCASLTKSWVTANIERIREARPSQK
jgi:hypothetical protein